VIALALTMGIAWLDQPHHNHASSSRGQLRQPARAAADRELSPERRDPTSAAVDRGRSPERRAEVSEIGPDRYAVTLRAPLGWLPSIANSVEVRPTFGGLRITSEIGDGILTAEGLTVTDPKLSALVGVEPGDMIRAINGHPPTGGFFLALVKVRRDPDSGRIRLDIERGGKKIERSIVIR
jgi:hypothetical protein